MNGEPVTLEAVTFINCKSWQPNAISDICQQKHHTEETVSEDKVTHLSDVLLMSWLTTPKISPYHNYSEM
jgi:hypothetical protein